MPRELHDRIREMLAADRRAPEIDEANDINGWLIGSWDLEVERYWGADVSAQRITAEAHFARALEGRAVQDVWIMPRRQDRTGAVDRQLNMYGTTVRAWDPDIRAWRITWINPAGGHREEQIGRKYGDDIVQVGARPDGTPTRWRFVDITADSFHWIGESLASDGVTWLVEGEFRARRAE